MGGSGFARGPVCGVELCEKIVDHGSHTLAFNHVSVVVAHGIGVAFRLEENSAVESVGVCAVIVVHAGCVKRNPGAVAEDAPGLESCSLTRIRTWKLSSKN